MKSIIAALVAGLFLSWIALTATNTQVLISETKVNLGESYVVEGWGDLGKNDQASLVCKYFNGRKVLTGVYWYSAGNFLGKDSCPPMRKQP